MLGYYDMTLCKLLSQGYYGWKSILGSVGKNGRYCSVQWFLRDANVGDILIHIGHQQHSHIFVKIFVASGYVNAYILQDFEHVLWVDYLESYYCSLLWSSDTLH